MEFPQKLDNYSELIIRHGLNLQPGQVLNIVAEPYHRELVNLIAEKAYLAGAKLVIIDFNEARAERCRLLKVADQDLKYVPAYVSSKLRELVDENWASLRILGMEFPDIFGDINPKRFNTSRIARYQASKYFIDEGIGKSRVQWTLAAAATPGWGKKVFPDFEPEQAEKMLWEQIFAIARVNRPDYLESCQRHNRTLQERAKRLSELEIDRLHFSGPGTDLMVGLSSQAIFKGGAELGPGGVEFEPNIPTEECFTTPDWRRVSGTVCATRPFYLNGKLVKELRLEFAEGEIKSFSASGAADVFSEYIQSDSGARRVGEVALVGVDSPVFQSGLLFQEILFDENAACHIAIGSAYKFCLRSAETMSAAELETIGFNQSSTHLDIMISSDQVDVTAVTRAGQTVPLLVNGAWRDF